MCYEITSFNNDVESYKGLYNSGEYSELLVKLYGIADKINYSKLNAPLIPIITTIDDISPCGTMHKVLTIHLKSIVLPNLNISKILIEDDGRFYLDFSLKENELWSYISSLLPERFKSLVVNHFKFPSTDLTIQIIIEPSNHP